MKSSLVCLAGRPCLWKEYDNFDYEFASRAGSIQFRMITFGTMVYIKLLHGPVSGTEELLAIVTGEKTPTALVVEALWSFGESDWGSSAALVSAIVEQAQRLPSCTVLRRKNTVCVCPPDDRRCYKKLRVRGVLEIVEVNTCVDCERTTWTANEQHASSFVLHCSPPLSTDVLHLGVGELCFLDDDGRPLMDTMYFRSIEHLWAQGIEGVEINKRLVGGYTFIESIRVARQKPRQREHAGLLTVCARVIQRAWRRCVSNPQYAVCRQRLMKEYTDMVEHDAGV